MLLCLDNIETTYTRCKRFYKRETQRSRVQIRLDLGMGAGGSMLLCCVDLCVEAVLTTLGPGIFDWEAAGGGGPEQPPASCSSLATSALPAASTSIAPNPCELLQPGRSSTSPWDASGSWARAPQGRTPPLRQGPPLQAEDPRPAKADRGVYF